MTTTTTTLAPTRAHEDLVHAIVWARHHGQPLFVAGVVLVVAAFVCAEIWRGRNRTIERVTAPVEEALHGTVKICHRFYGLRAVKIQDGGVTFIKLSYGTKARDYAHNPAVKNLDAALAERMGGPVSVVWGRRRGVVTIRLVQVPKAVEDGDGRIARAQTLARRLLGEEAKVESPRLNLTGKFDSFVIRHLSIDDAKPGFRADVDTTMQAKLGQRLQSQWDEADDYVTYRGVPDLPIRVEHPRIVAPINHVIPFGVDINGQTVAWDLDSDAPHCLVVGATGSGKSSTIFTILTEASWFADIRVCDYKRISLRGLKNWPGVTRIALDLDDIADLLITAEADMMARVGAIEREEIDEDEVQPIIIVMEEGTATILKLQDAHRRHGGEDGRPGKGEAPAKVAFDNLVLLGRQPHLHLLLAAQRPDAKIIDGAIRDQFGARVLLGRPKRGTHTMMELDEWITAGPRGRGVADTGAGTRTIQGWWTPDPSRYAKLSPADRAIIDGLRPKPVIDATSRVTPVSHPHDTPAPEPVARILQLVPAAPVEPEPEPAPCAQPLQLRYCKACEQEHPVTDFRGNESRCRESERLRQAAIRASKRGVPAK